MLRVLILTLLLAAGGSWSSLRAAVVPLSLEELVAIADDVVVVRVTDSRSRAEGRMIVTDAQVQILDSYKGKMKGTQTFTYPGGQIGPLVMATPDLAKLRPGEEAVLFVSRPIDRLSKEQKSRYNISSSANASYSIIGGFQGKIDIVEEVDPEAAQGVAKKSTDPVNVTARMARLAAGDTKPGDKAKAPTYAEFRNSLGKLVTKQREKAAQRDGYRNIVGVNGKFAVPDRSTDPVIRAFDPLPSMAYMSKRELDAALQSAYSADTGAAQPATVSTGNTAVTVTKDTSSAHENSGSK